LRENIKIDTRDDEIGKDFKASQRGLQRLSCPDSQGLTVTAVEQQRKGRDGCGESLAGDVPHGLRFIRGEFGQEVEKGANGKPWRACRKFDADTEEVEK
jgi:hypothetical protein